MEFVLVSTAAWNRSQIGIRNHKAKWRDTRSPSWANIHVSRIMPCDWRLLDSFGPGLNYLLRVGAWRFFPQRFQSVEGHDWI